MVKKSVKRTMKRPAASASMVSSSSSSKTCSTGSCCASSKMWTGVILLVIGILYLLQDMGTIRWWTYSWWTVAFLIMGLKKLCWSCCR